MYSKLSVSMLFCLLSLYLIVTNNSVAAKKKKNNVMVIGDNCGVVMKTGGKKHKTDILMIKPCKKEYGYDDHYNSHDYHDSYKTDDYSDKSYGGYDDHYNIHDYDINMDGYKSYTDGKTHYDEIKYDAYDDDKY